MANLPKKGKSKKQPQSQKLNEKSYVRLSSSNSGRYLGLFWPTEQKYQIWDLYQPSWNSIHEGRALDLAWYGSKSMDHFGIIGLKLKETEATIKRGGRLGMATNKKITVETQIQTMELFKIDENNQ